MVNMYTKEGRALLLSGSDLFAKSGKHFARIQNGEAYDPDGEYVGTIVGDRVIYRKDHRLGTRPAFKPIFHSGFGATDRGAIGVWGDEPSIPE